MNFRIFSYTKTVEIATSLALLSMTKTLTKSRHHEEAQGRRGDLMGIKLFMGFGVNIFAMLLFSKAVFAGPLDNLFSNLTEDEKYWPSPLAKLLEDKEGINDKWKKHCDEKWNSWLSIARQHVAEKANAPRVLRDDINQYSGLTYIFQLASSSIVDFENWFDDSENWKLVLENLPIPTEFSKYQNKYVEYYKNLVLNNVRKQMVKEAESQNPFGMVRPYEIAIPDFSDSKPITSKNQHAEQITTDDSKAARWVKEDDEDNEASLYGLLLVVIVSIYIKE